MKIAVFGAGAIGGYLAVKLRQAGADVTVIARGPHLAAMKGRGLTLKSEGTTTTVRLACTDRGEDAGPQDYVIATLKATGLASAAPAIAKLMGPETALVTAINGIPYWYFYGQDGPWQNRTLESVDPGGKVWAALPPRQAIGCIVYPAAEVIEPGVIEPVGVCTCCHSPLMKTMTLSAPFMVLLPGRALRRDAEPSGRTR